MFITDKQLDEWKEIMIGGAKKIFSKDGHLVPCAMIHGRNGENRIYAAIFEKDEDKEKFNKFIRKEIETYDALAYIFIAEAWRTESNIKEIDKYKNVNGSYKRPSESPEKIETVFVVFETSLKNEIITFDIDRGGKKPSLINEERKYKSGGGRFADVLRKPIINN